MRRNKCWAIEAVSLMSFTYGYSASNTKMSMTKQEKLEQQQRTMNAKVFKMEICDVLNFMQ